MSDAGLLMDAAIHLMIQQKFRYGRWHTGGCLFTVVPLFPSHYSLPLAQAKEYGDRGHRYMSPEEVVTWHARQPCWQECQTVQNPEIGASTQHIEHRCSDLCASATRMIERLAAAISTVLPIVDVPLLREIAERRRKQRRFHDGIRGIGPQG